MRTTKPKKCKTKGCQGRGMQNLATICSDWDNFYCYSCKSHWAGYNGKLKFYSKDEWEKQFELEGGSAEALNFFPR